MILEPPIGVFSVGPSLRGLRTFLLRARPYCRHQTSLLIFILCLPVVSLSRDKCQQTWPSSTKWVLTRSIVVEFGESINYDIIIIIILCYRKRNHLFTRVIFYNRYKLQKRNKIVLSSPRFSRFIFRFSPRNRIVSHGDDIHSACCRQTRFFSFLRTVGCFTNTYLRPTYLPMSR